MNELGFDKYITLQVTLNSNNLERLDLIKIFKHHKMSQHIDIQLFYLPKFINNRYATASHISSRDIY